MKTQLALISSASKCELQTSQVQTSVKKSKQLAWQIAKPPQLIVEYK